MALVLNWAALLAGGALASWAGWQRPILAILMAMIPLAMVMGAVHGGSHVDMTWTLQHWLLVWAFAVCALKIGVRRRVPWPALAVLAAAMLGAAAGHPHPELGIERWLSGLGLLAMPWLLPIVVLPSSSRQPLALTIGVLSLVSLIGGVALGLGAADFNAGRSGWNVRLIGMVNDPGLLALLSFAGFVVSVNEYARRGGPRFATLALVNLAILLLTGTRMAFFAAALFAILHARRSPALKARLRLSPRLTALSAAAVGVLLLVIVPTQMDRLQLGASFDDSSRLTIWSFYWEEFLESPIVGRGPGTHNLAGQDSLDFYRRTTHNTYLTLLVDLGIVGFCAVGVAAVHWRRDLSAPLGSEDRAFLAALTPALLAFGLTETVLTAPQALPIFAYLAALQAPRTTCRHRTSRAAYRRVHPPLRPRPNVARHR